MPVKQRSVSLLVGTLLLAGCGKERTEPSQEAHRLEDLPPKQRQVVFDKALDGNQAAHKAMAGLSKVSIKTEVKGDTKYLKQVSSDVENDLKYVLGLVGISVAEVEATAAKIILKVEFISDSREYDTGRMVTGGRADVHCEFHFPDLQPLNHVLSRSKIPPVVVQIPGTEIGTDLARRLVREGISMSVLACLFKCNPQGFFVFLDNAQREKLEGKASREGHWSGWDTPSLSPFVLASEALISLGSTALPICEAGLQDQCGYIRTAAAPAWIGNSLSLFHNNQGDPVPGLIRLVEDKNPSVRTLAVQALGELYGPSAKSAIPVLTKAIRDPANKVRVEAISVLGNSRMLNAMDAEQQRAVILELQKVRDAADGNGTDAAVSTLQKIEEWRKLDGK